MSDFVSSAETQPFESAVAVLTEAPRGAGPLDEITVTQLLAENAVLEEALAAHERNAALKAACAERGLRVEAASLNIKQITTLVAAKYGLTLAQLQSSRQSREYAWPRQEAMYVLYMQRRPGNVPRWSMPQIGAFLGGRDHTTVLYGIRRHCERNGLPLP